MITDRIGRHEVLLAINHDCNKICDFLGFFQSKQEKFREFFASSDKKSHLSARVMARTVQLLRHDAYCPISAEIGTIDSQSDLRIGGAKCRVHSQARKLPVREKLNVVSFILVSDLLSLKTQRVLKGL